MIIVRRTLVPALSLALLAACLNDRSVAPRNGDGTLSLRVATAAVTSQTVQVRIYFVPIAGVKGNALGLYDLYQQNFDAGAGQHRVAATFPLADCLSFFYPDQYGPFCDVNVELTLLQGTAVIDQQTVYAVRVRPGVVTESAPVQLSGSVPPVTYPDYAVRGVLVEVAGLVHYAVIGSDENGDIAGMRTAVLDSSTASTGFTSQFFDKPYSAISYDSPSQYAIVRGGTAMEYSAQVVDAQGNLSTPADIAGIDPPDPQLAPYQYAVAGDTTPTSLTVSSIGFPSGAGMQSIDYVVRSLPNQTGQDTVFMVCTVPVPDQSGTVNGVCPRTGPHFGAAMLTAVPLDSAGHWGHAWSCQIPGSCNGGIVFPGRRPR